MRPCRRIVPTPSRTRRRCKSGQPLVRHALILSEDQQIFQNAVAYRLFENMHSRLPDQSLHGAAMFFAYLAASCSEQGFQRCCVFSDSTGLFLYVSFSRVSWALEIGHSQRHSSDRWPSTYSLSGFCAAMGALLPLKQLQTTPPVPRCPIRRTFVGTALAAGVGKK